VRSERLGGIRSRRSDFLFCWIAAHRPARVVQVGCGVSTHVILRAAAEVDYPAQIRCVEPYPNEMLLGLARDGRIELIPVPPRSYPRRSWPTSPPAICSSSTRHTRSGLAEKSPGWCSRCFRSSPRGVNVHVHDIVFPYDHGPGVLEEDLFFWGESVLLQAFLTGNAHCQLEVSLSMLHHRAPDVLQELLWSGPGSSDGFGLAALAVLLVDLGRGHLLELSG